MMHLSEFVWTLRSSVFVVFNNFLLIDATDRSKISSDQKRFFIALSLYCREDMKSPKEDKKIQKSVVSDPGTREDLLNFLSFYTLVFLSCNYMKKQ